MMPGNLVVTAVALVWAWAAAPASAQPQSPDELLRQLIVIARDGDVDGFLARLTSDSRRALTASFASQAALHRSAEAFQAALDARFGKGTPMGVIPADDIKTAIQRLGSVEIVDRKEVSGDEVQLRVKTSSQRGDGKTISREDSLVARREEGAWRLSLPASPDEGRAAAQRAAVERLIREVQAGQHKDRSSAMIALSSAWYPKEGDTK